VNARTDREAARRTVSAKGEGDGGPRHSVGVSSAGACAVAAAHALTALTVYRASSQAALRHTSTAIGKRGWDKGFPDMPQASLPTRTAISEAVANGRQNPRHITEHRHGTISGRK